MTRVQEHTRTVRGEVVTVRPYDRGAPNFVDPGPRPSPPTVYVEERGELAPLPAPASLSVDIRTTYTDRAKGFQMATVPVALAFGVGALIVALVGWSIPAFSLAALGVFWVAFLAWWLVGWAIHHLTSPDGVALFSALLGYRYLRHEQKARLARMKGRANNEQ